MPREAGYPARARRPGHAARIGRLPPVDARELFAPLGPSYDRVGAALSLGQDPLWRRFLVPGFRPTAVTCSTSRRVPGSSRPSSSGADSG